MAATTKNANTANGTSSTVSAAFPVAASGRRATTTAMRGSMRRIVAALLCAVYALTTACGLAGDDPEGVHVAWMEFEPGYDPRDVDTLAWSTFDAGGPYRLTADINPVLLDDSDPDRPVRVLIHEALVWLYMDTYGPTAFVDGNKPPRPAGYDPATWYLSSGDTLPPLAPITPAEAAWAASCDPITVTVDGDEPLPSWVAEAIDRINAVAPGRLVLRR
jgi:hypothetical protein